MMENKTIDNIRVENDYEHETVADIAAVLRRYVLPSLAERLEAAWERERVTPGHTAATREALEFVAHMDDSPYTTYDVLVAVQKARAALSAPARNCDRYNDAPSAYADFIVPWKLDGHLDDVPTLQDFANWLFALAAERKGESDGSK